MNDWPGYEDVLTRFRQWLDEARAEGDVPGNRGDSQEPEWETDRRELEPSPEIGLFQLAEQFTALRHELKLETKSSRNLEEQTRSAVESMKQAVDALRAIEARQSALAREFAAAEAIARPLAEALAELDEALRRGQQAAITSRERFREQLQDELLEELDEQFAEQPWWRRWLARRWFRATRNSVAEHIRRVDAEVFGSLLEGYGLVQNRLRRALEQNRIERIECVGEMVDPNRMTVVEVTDHSEFPPGSVAEEIRPGYLWKANVLRYAEVKAVRK